MRKILLFAFAIVMLASVSGIVVGKEKKAVRPIGFDGDSKRSVRPTVRDQSKRDRSTQMRGHEMMAARQKERIKTEIERATKVHKEFAAELEAIKKLAEKEGAKKTAAKIQELIDKDKKKLEKLSVDMNKRMEEHMKRMPGRPRGKFRGGYERPVRGQRPGGERLRKPVKDAEGEPKKK